MPEREGGMQEFRLVMGIGLDLEKKKWEWEDEGELMGTRGVPGLKVIGGTA